MTRRLGVLLVVLIALVSAVASHVRRSDPPRITSANLLPCVYAYYGDPPTGTEVCPPI